MIANEVFVCGNGLLAHPVTYLFHLPPNAAHGAPNVVELDKRRLVIVDCRLHPAREVATWVSDTLAHRRPILLLCPTVKDLFDLEGRVGILPTRPGVALLIAARENSSGLVDFEVSSLEYSALPDGSETETATSGFAAGHEKPQRGAVQIECACTDFATLSTVFVSPESVDAFKMQVERAMEGRFTPLDVTPPTGVKYFLQVINQYASFTYSGSGVTNGGGSLTSTYKVWGFLSQTDRSNVQYLSAEGQISLSAGKLARNDQCDRGFGNGYLKSTLAAPMSFTGSVPTSGDGTFAGTVSFPVSYKSPLGGYQIWTYSASVDNHVSSWSCTSLTSGATLGSMWWMTSPCNGSNFNNYWKDAFSFWGHVHDLTGASTGSLVVNTVSAWNTSSLLRGYQTIKGRFDWQGCRFWGSSCSPGVYWEINAQSQTWSWEPSFSVDFTPIYP